MCIYKASHDDFQAVLTRLPYPLVGVSLVQDDPADHGARHAADDDAEPDATGVLLRAGEVRHHDSVLGEREGAGHGQVLLGQS